MDIPTHAIGGVSASSCSSAFTGEASALLRDSHVQRRSCRFPPFVSNSVCGLRFVMQTPKATQHGLLIHCPRCQRHVTRQKILNWKQSLKFPARPKVSREGVYLMEQLLCEPEDRLGSQTSSSVNRPNSLVVQARRSGFIASVGGSGSVDGAHLIKVGH